MDKVEGRVEIRFDDLKVDYLKVETLALRLSNYLAKCLVLG